MTWRVHDPDDVASEMWDMAADADSASELIRALSTIAQRYADCYDISIIAHHPLLNSTMKGTYTGIIDRIVQEKWAAFEILRDGEWVDEINTDIDAVPEEFQYEGAHFDLEIADDEILEMHPRPDKEQERQERIQELEERTREDFNNKE